MVTLKEWGVGEAGTVIRDRKRQNLCLPAPETGRLGSGVWFNGLMFGLMDRRRGPF